LAKKTQKPKFKLSPKTAARIIAIGGATLALLLTFFYLFLYKPGRVTHESRRSPDTTFRITLQPELIQAYVTSLAPGITRFVGTIPKFTSMQARAYRIDWVHALPYEITLLFEQPTTSGVGARLFVNPIPDNESFVSEVNASRAINEIPEITWQPPQLAAIAENAYETRGQLRSNLAAATAVGAARLPRYQDAHLLSVSATNAKGILTVLHQAYANSLGAWADAETHQALMAAWQDVEELELKANLVDDNRIAIEFALICAPGHNSAATMQALYNTLENLAAYLLQRADILLDGNLDWQNSLTLRGKYALTGFEPLLKRAMHGGR